MRKLLILSVLGLLTASAGCANNMGCGDTWRPGYYLFGWGRHQNRQTGVECCDPCGMSGATMMSAPAMMTSAPCCQ
jgi:hypothetical protein